MCEAILASVRSSFCAYVRLRDGAQRVATRVQVHLSATEAKQHPAQIHSYPTRPLARRFEHDSPVSAAKVKHHVVGLDGR